MFWKLLMDYAVKKGRRVNIMDRDGKEIYMIRYIVFKSRFLSLYIHRFLKSDDPIHHDHPWNFFTYVISKGYTEELMVQEPKKGLLIPNIVFRAPGSLAFRKAEATHRVILDRNYREDEQDLAPLTCCLLLRRRRIWGFVEPIMNFETSNESGTKDVTGFMWTNWKDFLGISESDPRFFGSE